MKKGIFIVVLFSLLLQTTGLLLVFTIQQGYDHFYMRSRIKNSEVHFQKFTITHEQYRRCKINSDEIILDGSMFDVKSVTVYDNHVELIAVHDKKEEQAIEGIKDHFDRHNSSNKDLTRVLFKIIASVYILPSFSSLFDLTLETNIYPRAEQIFYLAPSSTITSPPPETGV